MRQVGLNIVGVVTYWRPGGDVDRTKLGDALGRAGFRGFTPDPRTPYASLELALRDVFGGPTTLVRPLEKRAGFEVVAETRGRVANDYDHVATALLQEIAGGPGLPLLDPPDRVGELVHSYCQRASEIPGGSVSRALVNIVKALGGVQLREGGGLYWLPEQSADKWEKVADEVEKAGAAAVFQLAVPLDENTVKAVTEGLRAEVLAEVERIEKDILSGELGERALSARTDEAVALKAKLEQYEAALQTTLPVLHEAVDRAFQAAATGALLESAGREAQPDGSGQTSNVPAASAVV